MAPFLNEMKASTALIKHHADQKGCTNSPTETERKGMRN